MLRPRPLLALFLLVLWPLSSVAEAPDTTRTGDHVFDAEAGQLLMTVVVPEEYGADRENWDATQDDRGFLYVANVDGVLIYDGHTWRLAPTANRTSVGNLSRSEDGRVFVGADGDFGVMRPDSLGRMRYVSLLDHVPEEHRSFGKIQRVVPHEDGVYFMSPSRLFHWRPETETITAWAPDDGKLTSLSVSRDTPYVGIANRGLATLEDDTSRLVRGGEFFSERETSFSLLHPEHGLIVGTVRGLFEREGDTFRPFATGVQDALQGAWIRTATLLPGGTIAVATINEGVFLLAPDGTLRRRLPARDNPTLGLYVDREDGLWALQYGGMIRYDLGTPFTKHGADTGIQGTPTAIDRHRGVLHVTTTRSMYRLRPADGAPASFASLPAVARKTDEVQCWALLFEDDETLVGTLHGLARVGPDDDVDYLTDFPVYSLIRDQTDSSRVYAATSRGPYTLRRTADGWNIAPVAPEFESKVQAQTQTIVQEDEHTLWAVSDQGTYRLRGVASPDSITLDQFGPEQGLPASPVWIHPWRNKLVFGTTEGLKRFDGASDPPFVSMTSVKMPPGPAERVFLGPAERGTTWGFTSEAGPGRWIQQDSVWRWRPGPLHRFRNENVFAVHGEEEGRVVWFGTKDGDLLRYVPEGGRPRSPDPARIHVVSTVEPDSTVTADGTAAAPATLPFAQSSLRFTYGAPSLVQPDAVEYQHRLEGTDSGEWSDWTARTDQLYRNVSHGEHTFAVRARTAYGDTTATARYSFTILPPWYRTWWAYALYLLAAIGVVAGAVRGRTWQLRRRQRELETTVAERTREIEEQKERLKELDEAKSRFFANVSHEFRTPITLIQGPARTVREHIQEGRVDPESDVEQLSLIERNAQRLLRLVDQILGIARMEAGTYELDARPTDLGADIERIARTFEPLAEREQLELTVRTGDRRTDAPPVYVDREALEYIVGNLLSNAVKFTPEGGRITVTVTETDQAVEVAVADTGSGIPADQQEVIFDRFEQVDDTSTRPQEGVGIGLAFASDLVDLHGGSIDLESAEGEGTTVTVRFRRGTAPLSEDQLAAPDDSEGHTPAEGPERPPAPLPADAEPSPDGPAPEDSSSQPVSDGSPEPRSPKQVLVVDDNADVRQYVRQVLTPEFSVLEAADGTEGAEKAREHLPDVILADVMMPSVDGYEMTRRLKDHPETAAIPVIMVTARASAEEEVEGLQVGADDYVTKPFDADVLRQRVGGVITLQERLRRRLQQELADEGPPTADEPPPRSDVEREARTVIREHLSDPDFRVDQLAEKMAMGRTSLYRAFEKKTDQTPSELITEVRMETATELLERGVGSVTEVAYAVGYDTLSSFSRAYREYAGQSPSAVDAET